MKKPKSIELFAGAGGLALGLERAGFETIGLVEFDCAAAETLRKNRPNWNVIEDDIENISKQNLEKLFNIKRGDLDLLSGGPPCQSFSHAGKKLGLEDARGTLFYHYAVFLDKLQPKMFLFENVDGLLSHDKGKTFKIILNVLRESGYSVVYKILNAWDYGVAQKRKRLVVIGIRNDLLKVKHFSYPKKHQYKPVLRDVLVNVPQSDYTEYSEDKKEVFKLVPPGGYWRDIPQEIAKKYMKKCWDMGGGRTGILRRLSFDEPSLTVLTSPAQKQTDRCHPVEVRPFTVRENARIQCFPDDWEFCGSISQQYKQIGNAVPANLAYEVAKNIYKTLEVDMEWKLPFITKDDLTKHIIDTIRKYGDNLEPIDLKKFNNNIIDPIKMIFDANVYRTDWKTLFKNEIFRQRDKSASNEIGYFHQNIFKYIKGCEVPSEGWDIIFTSNDGVILPNNQLVNKIVCELKNKHNTMNSSSASKTFIRMLNNLTEEPNTACFLVEIIATKSQNITWAPSVDKQKIEKQLIRRVSIDKFYEIVTGEEDAFYRLCEALVELIPEIVQNELIGNIPDDTAFIELESIAEDKRISIASALFLLAFSSYEGFQNL
jgi:DNA (cytosine-5)-methyltransferase 1